MSGEDGPPAGGARSLAVARIVGAHGIRGGLRVRRFDPASGALARGLRVELRAPDGTLVRETTLEDVAPKPGSELLRIRVEGVDDRSAAETLRGLEIWVRREQLPPLADDEYYLADVVGASVHDGTRELGRVVAITSNGAQDLLEIESPAATGGSITWLLPALPGFVLEIDERGVRVDVPPGLGPDGVED
jgi:16S rRNA processing protein RimM